jgi:hypothetical protein
MGQVKKALTNPIGWLILGRLLPDNLVYRIMIGVGGRYGAG